MFVDFELLIFGLKFQTPCWFLGHSELSTTSISSSAPEYHIPRKKIIMIGLDYCKCEEKIKAHLNAILV